MTSSHRNFHTLKLPLTDTWWQALSGGGSCELHHLQSLLATLAAVGSGGILERVLTKTLARKFRAIGDSSYTEGPLTEEGHGCTLVHLLFRDLYQA